MATVSTPSRLLVRSAAAAAAGVAVATDAGLGEHPTHSIVLGCVAVVVWALHRRLARTAIGLTTLPAVSAALAAQPVLHLASKVGLPPADDHHHDSLLHVFASDAPVAGMQVVVPVVALIATTVAAHLICLLLSAVRRPLVEIAVPGGTPPGRVLGPFRAARLGSMLHWCGWVIRAARRGPPCALGHATS